jgi:hypothetical protein
MTRSSIVGIEGRISGHCRSNTGCTKGVHAHPRSSGFSDLWTSGLQTHGVFVRRSKALDGSVPFFNKLSNIYLTNFPRGSRRYLRHNDHVHPFPFPILGCRRRWSARTLLDCRTHPSDRPLLDSSTATPLPLCFCDGCG